MIEMMTRPGMTQMTPNRKIRASKFEGRLGRGAAIARRFLLKQLFSAHFCLAKASASSAVQIASIPAGNHLRTHRG
jgi:hypothetical protein